jgi:hypothetical protein
LNNIEEMSIEQNIYSGKKDREDNIRIQETNQTKEYKKQNNM